MERERKHRRIRRVKWLLRPLPRRTNVHRYPVLKWFAETARKRSFLWSFRVKYVVRAFYAGWVLTLLPVYGLQILIGVMLALALRANMMILVGLQLISNPLTVAPIWYFNYRVGEWILSACGSEAPPVISQTVAHARDLGVGFFGTLKMLLDEIRSMDSGAIIELIGRVLTSTSLGGLLIGLIAGMISTRIYIAFAQSARKHHIPVLEKIDDRPEIEEKEVKIGGKPADPT